MKILIVRQHYNDLQNSLIEPMVNMMPQGFCTYNSTMHTIYCKNGSYIRFGHYDSDEASQEYQGAEYDWIFIDEATQITESQFRTLGACLRGTNHIPKRMYLTCNPGGIGHFWVKRLFIDRDYKKGERAQDYKFIKATVEDNTELMKHSPEYVQMLDLLPEDIRKAHRYGDWDALSGQYFTEFEESVHVFKPFFIPREWAKYRVFDYGLDMFACLWIALDFKGNSWVYREYQQSGLIVSRAAEMMRDLTTAEENITYTIAPPDMWSRQKDTGKTMAELWQENGVGIVKASNNRVAGFMAMKEMLKWDSEHKPKMFISSDCRALIKNIQSIQHDSKNPSDCSTEPHEITHIVDAARYFCITRSMQPEMAKPVIIDDEPLRDYDEAMTGGEPDSSYLSFGGA
jgi:phage terminase large subunit